jgi:DNA polymerase V
LFDDNVLRANSAALMKVIDGINHSGWEDMVCRAGIEKSWR